MEREYSNISYLELHDICVNSLVRYKTGGKCVTLDKLQENINKYQKTIVLVGDESTWEKHSPYVVVRRKCVSFADGEYLQQE